MQVYYVYRLTCHHPETVKRYYIGFRSCRGNPVTDPYWSSSKPVKEGIARFGPEAFTKKIIAVYPTKKQALALEVKLHARLDVKNHPLFFNQSKQTSTKFTTSGSPSEPEGPCSEGARAVLAFVVVDPTTDLWCNHEKKNETNSYL